MVEVVDYSQPKQGVSPSSELMIQEQGNFGNSSQNLLTPESAVAGIDFRLMNFRSPNFSCLNIVQLMLPSLVFCCRIGYCCVQ